MPPKLCTSLVEARPVSAPVGFALINPVHVSMNPLGSFPKGKGRQGKGKDREKSLVSRRDGHRGGDSQNRKASARRISETED